MLFHLIQITLPSKKIICLQASANMKSNNMNQILLHIDFRPKIFLVFGKYHGYETKMSVPFNWFGLSVNQFAVAEIECGLFLEGKFTVGNNNKSTVAQSQENARSESLVITPWGLNVCWKHDSGKEHKVILAVRAAQIWRWIPQS